MTQHKVTIIIEDAGGVNISIRTSCEPEVTGQTQVTPALACAAELLEHLRSRTNAGASGEAAAEGVVDAQVVEEPKPFVAEGRFDADPGSFVPAEKKEDQA